LAPKVSKPPSLEFVEIGGLKGVANSVKIHLARYTFGSFETNRVYHHILATNKGFKVGIQGIKASTNSSTFFARDLDSPYRTKSLESLIVKYMFKGNGTQALYTYHDAIISSQQKIYVILGISPIRKLVED
jgi:hypothetical protein